MGASAHYVRGRQIVALVLSMLVLSASACTRLNPAFKPGASADGGESGDSSDTGDGSTAADSSSSDSSAGSEVDTGPDSTDGSDDDACPPGEAMCEMECIDILWDPENCGECGNECFAQESCVSGSCEVGKIIFVSSVGYSGAMGGLAGADDLCASHAVVGELEGEYKAWLADSNDSPATRMTHFAGGYRLPSGAVVAESWDDLTDGSLLHPIDENELGETPADLLICLGQEVWSGVAPNGNPVDQNHCLGWTTVDQAISHTGRYSAEDAQWTQSMCMSVPCTAELSIYCVQQ